MAPDRTGSRAGSRRWFPTTVTAYDERYGRWEACCVAIFWPLMLLSWFHLVPTFPLWVVLLPLLWRPITDACRGLARRPLRILTTGVVLFVVLFALVGLLVDGIIQPGLASMFDLRVSDLNTDQWTTRIRQQPWLAALTVLAGPFEEELTYRYGLFRLLGRLNSPLAHVITGLTFGLQHVTQGLLNGHTEQLLLVPGYLAFSVILTVAYRKTGNILATFLAHALYNGAGVTLMLLI